MDVSHQLCAAVAYLHRVDIIHRDLHVGNVLLSGARRDSVCTEELDGLSPGSCLRALPFTGKVHVEVCDFGKAMPSPADGEVVLPLPYRPPELLLAQGASLKARNESAGEWVYKEPATAKYQHGVGVWPLACFMVFVASGDLPFGHQDCGAGLLKKMFERLGAVCRPLVNRSRWDIFTDLHGARFLDTYGTRKRSAHAWPELVCSLVKGVLQWDSTARPRAVELLNCIGPTAACPLGSSKARSSAFLDNLCDGAQPQRRHL